LQTPKLTKVYEPPSLFLLVVHFNLWGIKNGTGRWEPYFTPEFLATCTDLRYHLMQCPDPLFDSHEVFVKIDGDRKYAWRCGKPGITPNSFCQGQFPLIDNVMLDIRTSRKYLQSHEEIVARAYERVCGFFQPGHQSTTYNYCEKETYHGKAR
jgi:hypothetical protein